VLVGTAALIVVRKASASATANANRSTLPSRRSAASTNPPALDANSRTSTESSRTGHVGAVNPSRAAKAGSLSQRMLSDENLARIRALNAIAGRRGQTLAQMAIAWVLRDPRITSALIGARTVQQLDDSLDAVKRLDFDAGELAEIDQHAGEGGIDLWKVSSTLGSERAG